MPAPTRARRCAQHGRAHRDRQDARDIAKLSYDLQQKLHLFGRYGITIFALSGLDIALWDIAAKGPACHCTGCWVARAATSCRPMPAC